MACHHWISVWAEAPGALARPDELGRPLVPGGPVALDVLRKADTVLVPSPFVT
jgi:hypothetical protein